MPRGTADLRSGGKMPKRRRTVLSRTPYDRPVPVSPPSPPPSESPNWLGRVVAPATRLISGATKVLSSVLNLDESSSESSSSFSSSDSEASLDDIHNEADEYILPDGVDGFNKGATSSGMQTCNREAQKTVERRNRKSLIEQLLMEETFSREECDRLISIINSRAMDETLQKGHGDILGKAVDYGSPELCNKAILEAKKWLKDKKVDEDSAASPVDMAKSYMQARPPWSSPSAISNEVKTSFDVGLEFLKESTTPAFDSGFSTKKRDLRSGGSWNIHEELRRVRTKATEDMLKSVSSPKAAYLSLFSPEPSSAQGSRLADKIIKRDELRKPQFSSPLAEVAPAVHAPEGNQDLKTILALEAVEDVVVTNGFQSQESLPEDHVENVTNDEKKDEIVDIKETSCQILRETDVEIPFNEIDRGDLGSQNSASMNVDEETSKGGVSENVNLNEALTKKRPGRNTRRGGGGGGGRGRGK
ncbi:protein KAKU4 isoform X2 [Impatiens glandulifera]|uniref:protein KAKU4 isoform X2 n=1 Tax=Impatiens glandulifera TaxID=253017 RepID=UPI001FB1977E|nr:protein KAKU4 isoform X2 [Impatiens glandulifera]